MGLGRKPLLHRPAPPARPPAPPRPPPCAAPAAPLLGSHTLAAKHFAERGYNAFAINRVMNFWMRQVGEGGV